MFPTPPEACRHAISMPVRSHARTLFSRSDARLQVWQLERAAESSWRTRDQLICCQASSSRNSSADNGGAQQASDMGSSEDADDAAEARTEGTALQLLALRGLLQFTEAKVLLAAVVQPTPTNSGRGALGLSLSAIGLQRGPLSGGVKNATLRYDLPSPAVAVRNLVSPGLASSAGNLCTEQPRPQRLQQQGLPMGSQFAAQSATESARSLGLALDGLQATRCAPGDLPRLACSPLAPPMPPCAGGAGPVRPPVHHHVQHAPPAGRLSLWHAGGLRLRRGRVPHLLPVPPGHPHAQHH